MLTKFKTLLSGTIAVLLFAVSIYSQANRQLPLLEIGNGANPPFITNVPDTKMFSGRTFGKAPDRHSFEDWQNAIDSVWGPGLPTSEKLAIFDKFWKTIDSSFACFHHLTINWDSLKQVYRPQIAAGVSRGRFCAIINHLVLLLKEPHTSAWDNEVVNTYPERGTPLFLIAGIGYTRFGAGLTPLPDSSALVYSTHPLHPLGLQRGDIILGYDGIPWKVLYKQLIEWELPIAPVSWIGSSPSSFTNSLLRSSGRNWFLFDTMDIVKYGSGDTVHLPTSLMDGTDYFAFCTEQMDIPGVPKPAEPEHVSYGIVQGTNIGYIYVYGWYDNAEARFAEAVQNLFQTDGLIIDFRYNSGGSMFLSNSGLSLLFDTTVHTINFSKRCSPDHLQLCELNISNQFIIHGNPPGYNKPIAVLTGQGAVSSGDQVAYRFKYHKRARFFGKPTSSAFSSPVYDTIHSDFFFRHAAYDAYDLRNPNEYLTHTEFPVDEEVWLTPALVAQGRDDVVEAAISWIKTITGISSINSETPLSFELAQNYPNPFNPSTIIKFKIAASELNRTETNGHLTKLVIFDITGREVETLVNEHLTAGTYEVEWNASGKPSGAYFYRLASGNFTQTKKMFLIK